jgi:Predicted NADH:ubiquinone oxidoreductase, subunit RnfC
MSGLFVVIILYLIPQWLIRPASVLEFLAVLALALVIDAIANTLRYKRMVCSVSAAVTAAVLFTLTPGVPLWGKLLGVITALIVGKHIWGGMGKNPINPALTGVILLYLLFEVSSPPFDGSLLLIPAIILSLPFIKFRPFAASGLMAGMLLSLSINGQLTLSGIISLGVIFWGCVIVTDPVTVTAKPLTGALMGIIAGLSVLLSPGFPAAVPVAILLLNIVSYVSDKLADNISDKKKLRIKIPLKYSLEASDLIDLTSKGDISMKSQNTANITKEEILKRIEKNNVFGFGGAAFPAIKKIRTVIESDSQKKYLIVNGVECDPGLIHDKWLLRHKSKEIHSGIRFLSNCIDFSNMTLAVKDSVGLEYPSDIRILKVKDYYPAGSEKALINEALGILLAHKTVPSQEGILVFNVQTILAIYEAVGFNQKADSRYLTVSNLKTGVGKVVRVNLEEKISDLVEKLYPGNQLCFKGGGIMQACAASEEDIIDSAVNSIAIAGYPQYKESPQCSKCGECRKYCPSGLEVDKISKLVDEGRIDDAAALNATECIKCGSCSYVCKAGRNLGSRVEKAKRQ